MQYGSMQSRGDLEFVILRDTWLKAVYAIFDQGNERIETKHNIDVPK
jgi:hypothetical protein